MPHDQSSLNACPASATRELGRRVRGMMRFSMVLVVLSLAGCFGHSARDRRGKELADEHMRLAAEVNRHALPDWWCDQRPDDPFLHVSCFVRAADEAGVTEFARAARVERLRLAAAAARARGHDTLTISLATPPRIVERAGLSLVAFDAIVLSPGDLERGPFDALGAPDSGSRVKAAEKHFAALEALRRNDADLGQIEAEEAEDNRRTTLLVAAALRGLGESTSAMARASSPPEATVAVDRGCSSRFDCGIGLTCVKDGIKPGKCMKLVDESGMRSMDLDPKPARCSYGTDCPLGFTCDREIKACVKR